MNEPNPWNQYSTLIRRLLRPMYLLILIGMSLPFLYMATPVRFKAKSPQSFSSPLVSAFTVSLSSDVRYALLGGNQNSAWLIDLTTGNVVQRFSTPSKSVSSVDLTPDGKTAVICEADGNIRLWNTKDGSKIASYSIYTKIGDPDAAGLKIARYRLALSPDASKLLLYDRHSGLYLLDSRSGKKIKILYESSAEEIPWFDFSPQKDEFYAYDEKRASIDLFNLVGDETRHGKVDPFVCRVGLIAPDGERILLAGDDREIRVWDVSSQKTIHRFLHPEAVTALYITPGSHLLYAGGNDGIVTVWNLSRFQYVRTLFDHPCTIFALGILPGGSEMLVFERQGSIWSWDLSQKKTLWSVDGFQMNPQKQIVAAAKITPTPRIPLPQTEIDAESILSTPLSEPVDFSNQRIDIVLDYISQTTGIPIHLKVVRSYMHRIDDSLIWSDWLEAILADCSLEYVVQTDGTIRIGRPETIAQYQKTATAKRLSDIPEINSFQMERVTFLYIEDLVREIVSKTNLPIVVEDDRFTKITFQRDFPMPREILESALFPNGLDYSISGRQIFVFSKEDAIDYSKTGIAWDLSIQSSLQLEDGFTPSQLEEMERQPELRLTSDELAAAIVNYHARFQTAGLLYSGTDCAYASNEPYLELDDRPLLEIAKQVMQLRKDGFDTFRDRIRSKDTRQFLTAWDSISNDRLEEYIRIHERLKSGLIRPATRTYTVGNHNRILEVQWPDDLPKRHVYYTNDKNEGMLTISKDNDAMKNYQYLKGFTTSGLLQQPDHPYRFGADLDWFLLCGYRITAYDPIKRKLWLTPINNRYLYDTYEFTLLDGHNFYWKQCDTLLSGRVMRRIVCGDFVEISGMLVPRTVSVQDMEGMEFFCWMPMVYDRYQGMPGATIMNVAITDHFRRGRVRYDYEMKLIEATVNQPVEERFEPPDESK